jgi:non-ribosomal peptide synthase protein (TIGR01720 family)
LRLRLSHRDSHWQLAIANLAATPELAMTLIDLSQIEDQIQQSTFIEQAAADLQQSLDLQHGPILRLGLFALGHHRGCRLALIIHHIAVDGVSWRILLDDLQSAYRQASADQPIRLPAKTTSFQRWAQALSRHARSDDLLQQQAYWNAVSAPIEPLPVDFDCGLNLVGQARTLAVKLTPPQTTALLRDTAAAYNTRVEELLLLALLKAMQQWSGRDHLLVDLEGHGREEIAEPLDLTRTVGWFTSIYPVRLRLKASQALGEQIKGVKEQLRQIPDKGMGYGLLRYMGDGVERAARGAGGEWAARQAAEVSFNYLGQFDQVMAAESPFRLAQESCGPSHSLRDKRSHLLDISGFITEGQLRIIWTYGEKIHRRETIEQVAESMMQELREIISHCQSPDTGEYTSSDFPLAGLDDERFTKLKDLIRKIDASAPK